jgi:hypothetical protein
VKTSVAAWAWCLWLLLLVCLAPPLNKLKAGLIQDLDLGSPVAASSVPLQGDANPAVAGLVSLTVAASSTVLVKPPPLFFPFSRVGAGGFFYRVWCWELWFSGIYLTVGESRPTTKVLRRPICKPTNVSGNETSMVRPSSRSHPAFIVSAEASGFVPAPVLNGGDCDLSLDGGEREESDCFLKSFSEVFFTNTRDLCVISISFGVLYKVCTATAYQ